MVVNQMMYMKKYIMLAQSPGDRRAVVAYVEKRYFQYFGTTPSESQTYLYAHTDTDDSIIGAIGLDFEDENGKMPLEYIYMLNRSEISLPLSPSNGAQFGKWNADTSDVSLPLLYAASVHAMKKNKTYGWLNHTDAVHRILTKKGVDFLHVNASLVLQNVRKEDLSFYSKSDAKCYIMNLQQVINALDKGIFEAVEDKKIVFGEF